MNAVVHAHPPGVMMCTIAGIKIRPIYGAFDASGMRIALGGLPMYERAITISSPCIRKFLKPLHMEIVTSCS